MAIFSRHCPFSDGDTSRSENHQEQCQKIARGEAIFREIVYFEHTHKFHLGIFPGSEFAYEGTMQTKNLALFFSFYFCMTGMHGIHVLLGMSLIAWVTYRHWRGDF